MNDVTADQFIGVSDNSIDQPIDKLRKDYDTTGRSNLNDFSKRSEAALNAQNKDTDDDDDRVLYHQPDLEKVFNNKEADRQGLSEQVLDNFIKEWGHRINAADLERAQQLSAINEVSSTTSL